MAGKKFKFSLQSVLTVRKHATESARQELGRIIQARLTQEIAKDQARARLQQIVSGTHIIGSVGPLALKKNDAYRREAQDQLERAQIRLSELDREEADAREVLLTRKREEEALETLRDQQLEIFMKEVEASELAFIDEQAVTRRYQKNRLPQT